MGSAASRQPLHRPARWGRRLCWLVPLVLLAALLVERWRGQYALRAWLKEKEAQGEIFEPERLWPPPKPTDVEFSNRLTQAVGHLPKRWREYGGRLPGIVMTGPAQARRGSQESNPPIYGGGKVTNSWQDLEGLVSEGEPALHELRELMKSPATSMGLDIDRRLQEFDSIPNFISVRVAAQAFHVTALAKLHQGDLEGALEDLEALSAFERLYVSEPFLAGYMIRIAILGLSADVAWDALQAEGWTEPQLARLQQVLSRDELRSQMPSALMGEQSLRLQAVKWFASHSYEDWLERYQELLKWLGYKPPACDVGPVVRRWRQWVFHPLWRFAWADQEELHYLQTSQKELTILREAVRRQGCIGLNQQLAEHYRDYRPPAASWRFYISLPLVDHISGSVGNPDAPARAYPFHNYSSMWSTSIKNLTIHEMVKTVVALNRYQLRHGRWPENLEALVPDYLPTPPRDWMDGRILRYRLKADGSFVFYSVGQDGKDEGGDPTPAPPNQDVWRALPWNGIDWVWPRCTAPSGTEGRATSADRATPSTGSARSAPSGDGDGHYPPFSVLQGPFCPNGHLFEPGKARPLRATSPKTAGLYRNFGLTNLIDAETGSPP